MSENKMATKADLQRMYNKILPYLGGTAEAGFTPVGTVIAVMGNSAPANYLACNGQVVNIADYPVLADYFEAQFGTKNHFGGDGTTTFAVPDLRGEFLRGTGTNSHANQGNGAAVGVHQNATEVPHFRTYTDDSNNIYIQAITPYPYKSSFNDYVSPDVTIRTNPPNEHQWSDLIDSNSPSSHTGEWAGVYRYSTRPTNTSVLFCIATHNIFINPELQYSTQEQVVGTWIDGKSLYQKTIEINNPATDWTVIDLMITNSEYVRKVDAEFYQDSIWLTEFYNSSSDYISCGIFGDNSMCCRIKQVGNPRITKMNITIQYTKTTDV